MTPEWKIVLDLDPTDPCREWAVFKGHQYQLSGLSETQATFLVNTLNEQQAKIRFLIRELQKIGDTAKKLESWY